MREILIKAENIYKTYKSAAEEINAANGIDLEIRAGDFISMMGSSGSGKTTLLDILGCLDSISRGKLEVFGKDVSNIKEKALVNIRRGKIGFVFQDFHLLPSLTALENVELPLCFSRMTRKKEEIVGLLEKIGLGQRINHLPKELSGGEKQRVAIARALATSPKLLLADEPTGDLDSKTSQEIFDILKTLNEKDGVTIVVVTHDEKLGQQAKRVIHLQDGKIV
jgi:ABC-type lipoprotein export system ATPase subunit